MPIYDFECRVCKSIFEEIVHPDRKFAMCKCGHTAEKIFSGTHFVPFKPYIETNLGDEPIEIKSKKQLRRECEKVGADYQ